MTDADDKELLVRQGALQREADQVRHDLQIDGLLGNLGEPILVGSAALGLMVWRDLDLTVVCQTLEIDAVLGIGRELAHHPRIREVDFRNDTGRWNQDPLYPNGLYLGLLYVTDASDKWNLDIWFVTEPERQPDLQHLRTLPARLNDETRRAILRIKDHWRQLPDYGSKVRSYDIYSAVLDHGIDSIAGFERFIARP